MTGGYLVFYINIAPEDAGNSDTAFNMKNIQNILILILSVAVVYLFVSNRYKVERLDTKIASLESSLIKTKDDCETRLAYLKTQKGMQEPDINNTGFLGGLISRAAANTERLRNDNLKKMGSDLALTEIQQNQVALIIAEMEREKKKIPGKAAAENISVFDTGYIEMLNKVNKNALAKFNDMLTNQQYKLMLSKGYDQKLGFRVIQKPQIKEHN